MCPKPAGETLGLFWGKEPNNKIPYMFCDTVVENRDFAQDTREGSEKTDFSTSVNMRFQYVFPRIGHFCAQSPLVDPQPLDQRALGTKLFERTFPKILESNFFQRCFKLCLSRLELRLDRPFIFSKLFQRAEENFVPSAR